MNGETLESQNIENNKPHNHTGHRGTQRKAHKP